MVGMPIGNGITEHNFRAVFSQHTNDFQAVFCRIDKQSIRNVQRFTNGSAQQTGRFGGFLRPDFRRPAGSHFALAQIEESKCFSLCCMA